MKQNEIRQWEPPPVGFQRLAARLRELDPRAIVGVCSSAENDRLEKEVDRLEAARRSNGNKQLEQSIHRRTCGALAAVLGGLQRYLAAAEKI